LGVSVRFIREVDMRHNGRHHICWSKEDIDNPEMNEAAISGGLESLNAEPSRSSIMA
jgi:hypothetical protein